MLTGLTDRLRGEVDARVLVGFDTSDDAGVYVIGPGQAIVVTADLITPVTDDPWRFGQVAAANSLSDVYAMGGQPITALNLCCFPCKADPADLGRILEGALDKIREAGAHLLGGHSVQDDELKFGLSVNGLIDPDRVVTNGGARPGDALVLTKPLGTGLVIGGRKKRARWVAEDVLEAVLDSMATLNATAGRLMVEHGASAATDVTGFGLAGHGGEMARASAVGLRFRAGAVPFFDGVTELVDRGVTTRVTATNRDYVASILHVAATLPTNVQTLFFDPQTSGGLLISIAADRVDGLLTALHGGGVPQAAIVGEVFESPGPQLEFVD